MEYTIYEDDKGFLYRVSSGISSGKYWMTVRIGAHGAGNQHRVKSKNLPIRMIRQDAQDDLDAWAELKNLRVVGSTDAAE